MMRRYCQVCLQTARPTRGGNIAAHWDSKGINVCPMSDQPYELAGYGRPILRAVEEGVVA